MKTVFIALYLGIFAMQGISWAVQGGRSTRHPQLNAYRHKLVNREAAGRAGASAAINTARNYPHEWGGGVSGFAKRAGSAFGQHLVKGSIEFGVSGLRHEDLRYQRSHLNGNWPRLKYAVKSTFIVPRTNRGGKTLAVSRIAGNMGGGLVSRAWQPASAAGLGAGLASGGVGIGAEVGVNVAREFWPRRKRQHAAARPKTRTSR